MQSLASHSSVDSLVLDLASKEPAARERARTSLAALHTAEAAEALCQRLKSPDKHVRWEAGKTLSALADPCSAECLVEALRDENEDVRWVASDALIKLGTPGIMALLKGLMRHASSTELCSGARHVLHAVEGPHASVVSPVLRALEHDEPGVSVPPAAYHAWLSFETILQAMLLASSRKPVVRWD
jgi:HEAT repeat protein